jgi:phage terminase large subunit-like protein
MATPSPINIPRWDWFVQGALSGNIKVCELVRLACQRHQDDLERSKREDFPYKFSSARARYVIDFFKKTLVLTKGLPKPRAFEPEPWQQFILAVLFGWIRKDDGLRRFRKANIGVPRKNGKSHLLAGIGLYGLLADGEYGAEVYTAATKKDQAKMIFDAAVEFRRNSEYLKPLIAYKNSTLSVMSTGSKFVALSSDEDGLDGLNVSLGEVDEYQNHKTDVVRERIATGTSQRLQPLVITIGTAGTDRLSPAGREHDLSVRVLRREAEDETYFAFISEADENDDWESEDVWAKVNLNLGVSKTWEYMRSEAQGARNDPSKLNAFKRLDLNIWTQQEYVYLPMNRWRLCVGEVRTTDDQGKVIVVNPRDREAVEAAMRAQWRLPIGGMDLSSKDDITALVNLFPPKDDDPRYVITCRFWVPQDGIERRSKNDKVPYDLWAKSGLISTTPGETVDYDFIRAKVDELNQKLHYQVVGCDPWNALQLMQQLKAAGVPIMQVTQSFRNLQDATKELLAWTLSQKIQHLGDPVLTWMAGNMAVRKDAAGNVMPDKSLARERMDGISALVNAIYCSLQRAVSVYSSRGIITI